MQFKLLVFIFFIFKFCDAQIQDSKNYFWNQLTLDINEKVDMYNSIGESVMDYNKRIYQFYVKRDSASFGAFRVRNPIKNLYLNLRKQKRIGKNIEKFIQDQNQPEVSALIHRVNFHEKKLIKQLKKFSIYQDYNYKYNLDSTNAKFSKVKYLFGLIDDDLYYLRKLAESHYNTQKSIKNNKLNEVGEYLKLCLQARDSLEFSTVASMYPIYEKMIPANFMKIHSIKDKSFDKSRLENFRTSLEAYAERRFMFKFKYFPSFFYFSNQFIDEKVKISHRFNNHLVHLLSTNTKSSISLIDWFNRELLTSKNTSLMFQKPMILIDPLRLTRNNGFGRPPKIVMPQSFTIVLLDVSGSMNKENRLERCKDALKKYVIEKEERDYFSTFIFSRFSTKLFNPEEKDKDFQLKKIEGIRTFNHTNPELVIEDATSLLRQYPVSRYKNRIILITDGNFIVTNKMNQLMYQMKGKRTSFSLILLKGKEGFVVNNDFNELTEVNNGRVYEVNPEDSIYQLLIDEINRDD